MPNNFRKGWPTNFKLVQRRIRRSASATSAATFKVKGQGRKVTWRVWEVLADKPRTKRLRNPKISIKVVHPTGNNAHQFQGQRSKVKITRSINAEPEVCHIFRTGRPTNFKLGTQTEHEDPHQRQAPWPPTSKVKVLRSRDVYERCWPTSRERNILKTPKLVGRLSIPQAVMRTTFKVKGQGHQDDYCWDRQCVISSKREGLRTSNLVHRRSTKTRITDKRRNLQGQRSRSQGHMVRLWVVGPLVENEKSQKHQNW